MRKLLPSTDEEVYKRLCFSINEANEVGTIYPMGNASFLPFDFYFGTIEKNDTPGEMQIKKYLQDILIANQDFIHSDTIMFDMVDLISRNNAYNFEKRVLDTIQQAKEVFKEVDEVNQLIFAVAYSIKLKKYSQEELTKIENYEANRKKRKEEWKQVMSKYEKLSPTEQLIYIASDVEHQPNYYHYNFSGISDDMLLSMTNEQLSILEARFRTLKAKKGKAFYNRVVRVMNLKNA